MITARVSLGEYANRVLMVVKAKYGLKDKSAALNRFIELYGDDEVEKDAKDSYVRKILKMSDDHIRKYGYRHTSIKALRKEIEGE